MKMKGEKFFLKDIFHNKEYKISKHHREKQRDPKWGHASQVGLIAMYVWTYPNVWFRVIWYVSILMGEILITNIEAYWLLT